MIKKLFLIQILILSVVPNSIANDINMLIKNYKSCRAEQDCKKREMSLIENLINRTDINNVVANLDINNIKYKILSTNVTGSKDDYVIEMLFENIGFVAVVIRNLTNKQYELLPLIETGYIFDVKEVNITGDDLDEISVVGLGTGTDYQEKWQALYKYRDHKMNVIWSGIFESNLVSLSGILEKQNYQILFKDIPGRKAKEIVQTGSLKKVKIKTNEIISEQQIKKVFNWSSKEFKYREKTD